MAQQYKEELRGNGFECSFEKRRYNKHWAGCSCCFGTVVVCGDLRDAWIPSFQQANHWLRGFAGSISCLDRSTSVRRPRDSRRPQHFAGLSRKTWGMVHCAVSRSSHVMMHKFWKVSDPMMAQMQMVMFMKNVSMLGGALLVSHFGAGPFSLYAGRSR